MVKNQSDSIQFNPFLFNPRLQSEWLQDQNYSVWINPSSNWIVENLPMNKIHFCKVSEKNSIWTNPNHSEICLLIFRNDSEKRFEFCSMQIGFKSIWLNPIYSGSIWGFNPNESDPFQNLFPNYSKSFWNNTNNVLNFVWCKLVEINLIQYNPIRFNRRFQSEWLRDQNYSVWINPSSDWIRFIRRIELLRIFQWIK